MEELVSKQTKQQIMQDYISGMRLADICRKFNIPLNTLKSWVRRYHWNREKDTIRKTRESEKILKEKLVAKYTYNQLLLMVQQYEGKVTNAE